MRIAQTPILIDALWLRTIKAVATYITRIVGTWDTRLLSSHGVWVKTIHRPIVRHYIAMPISKSYAQGGASTKERIEETAAKPRKSERIRTK